MADTATAATSTRARTPHYFQVGTDHYSVSLSKTDYSSIASILKYSTTKPADSVINHTTVGQAMQDGILFALKVSGIKGSKKASAKVYVPRAQIEEAFTQLVNKSYGQLKIAKVAPVTHRIISA